MDKVALGLERLAEHLPAWQDFDLLVHGPALTVAVVVIIVAWILLKGLIRMAMMVVLAAALASSGFLDPYVGALRDYLT